MPPFPMQFINVIKLDETKPYPICCCDQLERLDRLLCASVRVRGSWLVSRVCQALFLLISRSQLGWQTLLGQGKLFRNELWVNLRAKQGAVGAVGADALAMR